MTKPNVFNVRDWYWQIGDDNSQYWSSASSTYVSSVPEGLTFTRIANEVELNEVLEPHGLRGPLVTAGYVVAEQRRRLAQGFDFDFGNERGVHHIATTEQDMKDWSEVTTWATVKLLTGDTASKLTIATNTGVAEVTAPEWMAVLNAGTLARQPIYQGAFWLMAQDPIPSDYASNEAYWSGQ